MSELALTLGRGQTAAPAEAGGLRVGERWAVGAIAVAIAMIPALAPPGARPIGPGNSSPVDLLIGLAIGITFLWALSSRVKLRLPYGLAVGLAMIAGILPGIVHYPAPAALAVLQDLVLLAFTASIVNISRFPAAFKVLTTTWAYASIIWALALAGLMLAGQPELAGTSSRWGHRAALTFGDPNMAASYFVIAVMIVAATRRPRNGLLRMAAYAVFVLALVYTGSNGGVVALLVATAVSLVVYSFRRLQLGAAIFILATIVLLGWLVVTQVHYEAIQQAAKGTQNPLLTDSVGRSDESAALRETLIQESSQLYRYGGPLGWGAGSTESALLEQQATFVKGTHDDYIAALVERGYLGVLALLLLISSIAVRTQAILAQPLKPEFAAIVVSTGPLLGALVATATMATFYQVLHFRHVWTLFAIVAALYLWGRRQ